MLARHPAIEQAAVAASEPTASGDRELVAGYLLRRFDGGASPSTEVRGWLRTQLPDYFVPARVAALERLPVTPSGKLDRKRAGRSLPGSMPARETESCPRRSGR